MNFPTSLRDRRYFYGPTHYSIANYCTETKNEMKPTFGDQYFFDNLHNFIPEQLKKNLADSINEEKMPPNNEFSKIDVKTNEDNQNRTDTSPLTGITNFLSGVLNVISTAMFSKRKTDYSSETHQEMAAECAWHPAKSDDENKILQNEKRPQDESDGITAPEMADCKAAAAHCQNKLDQVRLLLSKPVPCNVRVKRRPKRVFVESSSVEDCFEDAFAPEDFESLSNNSYLEYVSPFCYHNNDFHEISTPKVKTEKLSLCEKTDIVQNVPEKVSEKTLLASNDKKEELIASCEDKLSKLKALLQERKKKMVEPQPLTEVFKEPPKPKPKPVNKIKDKHHKNPNRCTNKRRKSQMKHFISNDLLFANEINTDDLSSVENSPSQKNLNDVLPKTTNLEYFDEISGRFHSTSVTDSDDSFQIVFNDNPRLRRSSDCESEDSFIIFDDSQDNCYTNNDVFRDSSGSDSCYSDSELSDSGCDNLTFKLSHSLSKSVGNLTDDSLYNNASEDEVDCSKVGLTVCEVLSENEVNSGLLIDSRKRQNRRSLPPKKVHFSSQPPKVHVMRVWAFAAKQARAGHWERYARDRDRFQRRIADVEVAVSWVLRPQHRSRVMFQRFMPWWNAEKRRELAEKEEEKKAQEQVRLQEQIADDTLRTSLPDASSDTEKLRKDQEQVRLQEQIAEDILRDSLPYESAVTKKLKGQNVINNNTSTVTPNVPKEHVGDNDNNIVKPSVVAPSQSKELDKELVGNNNENKQLDNLVDVTKIDSTNYTIDNQQLKEDVDSKDVHNIRRESNKVNIEAMQGREVDNLKHYAAKLQNGEYDQQLDDSPKFGEFVQRKCEEFNNQDPNINEDDIQELDNDILKHKETLNDRVKHNNDKLNRNDLDGDDIKINKEINLPTNTKNDSKNTVNQSKSHYLNDSKGGSVTNNCVRADNDRGTNDSTRNNQIVPYNDKIFSIDLVVHTLKNA